MKLVIDIDEDTYNDIMNWSEFNVINIGLKLREIAQNGILLPEEHGRLIYAKDAIETLQIMFAGDEDIQNACEQCISDCPTVIEADKEN